MSGTLAQAFRRGFLGNAPAWYKRLVFAFLLPWLSYAFYVIVALMWLIPDRRVVIPE